MVSFIDQQLYSLGNSFQYPFDGRGGWVGLAV
jgi:hypothetical protein